MQSIKKLFVAILVFSILCASVPFTPRALADIIVTNVITSTFNYDLQVGSEGQDVLNLQKFLNAYEDTAVAFSGTGSRGYESTSFGGLTKSAVIKFQKKYSISPADGYVGLSTRQKLNELYPTTDFNAPYPPKTVVVTKTVEKTSGSGGINLCQFVDLLIAIDAIKPEKASQARGLITGCTSSSQNMASTKNATSSYWTSLPKNIDLTTATADATAQYYDTLGNLNLYGDVSAAKFTGGKSLGDIRSYAVFAGGSLTNTNSVGISVSSTTSTSTSSTTAITNRTFVTGDVSAETEQDIISNVVGSNLYGTGVKTKQLSSLNKAIDSASGLVCDSTFSASSTDIGGRTFGPGVYCFTGDIVISNPITLSNPASTTNPKATTTGLYVFKTSGNLITKNLYPDTFTGTNKQQTIKYAGSNVGFDDKTGLPPYSVFWITAGNADIANNTIFLGTIMTKTGYINVGENTDIPEGRVLTRTAITLNKNLINVPSDPVKVTVNLSGKSKGTVTGPGGFSCSTEDSSKSTSAAGTSTLNKGGVTCQAYYKLGETITLTASPMSKTEPAWQGCDNLTGKNPRGKTCTITLKDDRQITTEFFLDTFRGITGVGILCLNGGWVITVVGGNGGTFFSSLGKPSLTTIPVSGTLKDGDVKKSCNMLGSFRVIEDMDYF
jgi:hypothetical protein